MEPIAVLLLLLIVAGTLVRISFFTRPVYVWLFALSTGVIVFLLFPYAIRQNRLFLQTILADFSLVRNIVLLLTIEILCLLYGNLIRVQQEYADPYKATTWAKQLRKRWTYAPGFSFLLSLYYFEVQLFLQGWNLDFTLLAVWAAVGVIALTAGCYYLFRRLLSENEARLEWNNSLYGMQWVTAMVLISAGGEATASSIHSKPDLAACAGVCTFFAVVGALGYVCYQKFK
jgi:hypothetical protein